MHGADGRRGIMASGTSTIQDNKAGMDGSRTHRRSFYDRPPVLKTGEATGPQPPPCAGKHTAKRPNRQAAFLPVTGDKGGVVCSRIVCYNHYRWTNPPSSPPRKKAT